MRIIQEIESEFQATRTTNSDTLADVHHIGGSTVLNGLALGADFISGIGPNGIVAYPRTVVVRIAAKAMPEQSSVTLSDFLSAQRLPVRIEVKSNSVSHRGWLLNVQGSWLRLATELQVIWCPIEAVTSVEVKAVENL
ncbi:MAG: hypothetical protein P8M68_03625 [Aquiluna sp.]|nr:hypothetical protein [Aquiluna sp.]